MMQIRKLESEQKEMEKLEKEKILLENGQPLPKTSVVKELERKEMRENQRLAFLEFKEAQRRGNNRVKNNLVSYTIFDYILFRFDYIALVHFFKLLDFFDFLQLILPITLCQKYSSLQN